jgi:hypothetical protein
MIDTKSWEVLYEVPGGPSFTQDGRYLIANNSDDDYGNVQLVDAATGEILDETLGGMYFSNDAKLLYRTEHADYDNRTVQIIELATGKILFEDFGWINGNFGDDNESLELFNPGLPFFTFRLIDLTTGQVIIELENAEAEFWAFDRNFILVGNNGHQQLIEIRTDRVLIDSPKIEYVANSPYLFTSDGEYVEAYGAPDARVETMPPP